MTSTTALVQHMTHPFICEKNMFFHKFFVHGKQRAEGNRKRSLLFAESMFV